MPKKKNLNNEEKVARTAERVEFCYDLICAGKRQSEVKKAAAAKFRADTRSVERWIRAAREQLVKESALETRDAHRGQALAFLEQIRDDVKVDARDRLRAQEQITQMLNLRYTDRQIERQTEAADVTITSGPVETIDEMRARLLTMAASIRGNLLQQASEPSSN